MYTLEKWSAPFVRGEDSNIDSSSVLSAEGQGSYAAIQRVELRFVSEQMNYRVLYRENRHINFWRGVISKGNKFRSNPTLVWFCQHKKVQCDYLELEHSFSGFVRKAFVTDCLPSLHVCEYSTPANCFSLWFLSMVSLLFLSNGEGMIYLRANVNLEKICLTLLGRRFWSILPRDDLIRMLSI